MMKLANKLPHSEVSKEESLPYRLEWYIMARLY